MLIFGAFCYIVILMGSFIAFCYIFGVLGVPIWFGLLIALIVVMFWYDKRGICLTSRRRFHFFKLCPTEHRHLWFIRYCYHESTSRNETHSHHQRYLDGFGPNSFSSHTQIIECSIATKVYDFKNEKYAEHRFCLDMTPP